MEDDKIFVFDKILKMLLVLKNKEGLSRVVGGQIL